MSAAPWPAGHRVGGFELLDATATASGFVYRARDHALGRPVAVEEYLPPAWARRDGAGNVVALSAAGAADLERGLRLFADEARVLARCDHPALLRVLHLEQAHGSFYQVTPWYEAQPLLDVPLQRGSPFSEPELRALLDDVLGALDAYHHAAGVHGGIGAQRVLWLDTGRALLLGPGAAARAAGATTATDTGFVAAEQLPGSTHNVGPWTDFHALAAVARYGITGLLPSAGASYEPIATTLQRMHGPTAAVRYHPALLRALDAALSPNPRRRPQTAQQFKQALGGGAARPPAAQAAAAPQAAATFGAAPFGPAAGAAPPARAPAPWPPLPGRPPAGPASENQAAASRPAARPPPAADPSPAQAHRSSAAHAPAQTRQAATGHGPAAPRPVAGSGGPALPAAAPAPTPPAPAAAPSAPVAPAADDEEVDAATLAAIRSVLDSIPDAPPRPPAPPQSGPADGASSRPPRIDPPRIDWPPGPDAAGAGAQAPALQALRADRPQRPAARAADGGGRMRWLPWVAAAAVTLTAAGYAAWRWLPPAGAPPTAADPEAAAPAAQRPWAAAAPPSPTPLPSGWLAPLETSQAAAPAQAASSAASPAPADAAAPPRALCQRSGAPQQRCLQRECALPRNKTHAQCRQWQGARKP